MKKVLSIILAITLCVAMLAGCSTNKENNRDSAEGKGKKIKIVTTIFPEYDWVREILGDKADNADITLLLDNGVDLHSYSPSTDDIVKISNCDMFIYVGGESDTWAEKALKEAKNKNMVVINLMDTLGKSVKEEEVKEGMEAEKEESNEQCDEKEYDEHVWLSLKNSSVICKSICQGLCKIDSKNAEVYKENLKKYTDKLSALDKKYKETMDSANRKTLLFGDRFPFRYLVEDYGLNYYAAFVGCSAETEASFKTIAFLSNKVDELSLPCVMTIEGSDHAIAKSIIKNTKEKNQKILTLDSMQSTTKKDIENGATYYSVMEKNLETLKKALK